MHLSRHDTENAWLSLMVGNGGCVREARSIDLKSIASTARDNLDREQIDLDLKRNLGQVPEQILPIRTVLLSWTALNSGIGYSQGMDIICIVLYNYFCTISNSPQPEHDTLAALGFVCRVNAGYLPLHNHDRTPISNAALFASEVWLEVSSARPRLGDKILPALECFEVFALQHMSVCFANLFQKDVIQTVWGYLFRGEANGADRGLALKMAARRCRHLVSASVLHYKKLWLYGKDERQSFQIWGNLLQMSDSDAVKSIIDISIFLERVETLGGAAQ